MVMKISWNWASTISKIRHAVASGFSSCSLVTWVYNEGAASVFTLVGLRFSILFIYSLTGTTSNGAKSTSALIESLASAKSIGTYVIFLYLLSDSVLGSGLNFTSFLLSV